MSSILLRLAAAAAVAAGLSACATTAPGAREGGTWSTRSKTGEARSADPRSGGRRVIGGTARSVRPEDLRERRSTRGRPVEVRDVSASGAEDASEFDAAGADARIAADLASLTMPVGGFSRERLRDTFHADRDGGARRHNAIDLGAPTGTPVLAAAPGVVRKIHTSAKGGLTVYVLGRDGRTVFYYAHLSRYAPGLAEGQRVAAGDRLGDVGETGNAQGAHLHFAIWRSRSRDAFWSGEPLNPYSYLRGASPAVASAPSRPAPVLGGRDASSAPAPDPRRASRPADRETPPRRGRW